MIDTYELLANAIIFQAVKDYRYALKRLKKHPHNNAIFNVKQDIELFFRSEYYTTLTTFDSEKLISKLAQEVL